MDKGLNEAMAVLLVTIVLTGDAFFQAPLGWVADKFGIRRVHLSCAVVFVSPWRRSFPAGVACTAHRRVSDPRRGGGGAVYALAGARR